MNKFRIIALAAITLAASAAQAQWYGEANYARFRIKESDVVGALKASPGGLLITGGYEVHPNLAVEASLGLRLGSDELTVDGQGTGIDTKLDRLVGVYVKPKYAISDDFEVFARLGYQKTDFKLSLGGATATVSDKELAYGIGASYRFDKNLYLTGAVMHHAESVNGVQIGLGYKF
ncbi:porin family protein [Ramlibacter sp. MAHUQ-53]|uniref:porin family protein n=1 Tax=unclassified Ramlibacter TaxID=2617605 RepID=UPI003632A1FC